jgi:hypothetical protein
LGKGRRPLSLFLQKHSEILGSVRTRDSGEGKLTERYYKSTVQVGERTVWWDYGYAYDAPGKLERRMHRIGRTYARHENTMFTLGDRVMS